MNSPKELRAIESKQNRSNAINRMMASNNDRIADLETQILIWKGSAALFALIIGSAVFPHYF